MTDRHLCPGCANAVTPPGQLCGQCGIEPGETTPTNLLRFLGGELARLACECDPEDLRWLWPGRETRMTDRERLVELLDALAWQVEATRELLALEAKEDTEPA
jgi:hypothetical protein